MRCLLILGLILSACDCAQPKPLVSQGSRDWSEPKDTKRSRGISGTIYSIEEIVQDELPEAPDFVKILWDKKLSNGRIFRDEDNFFVNFTDHHDGKFPRYRLGSKVKLYSQTVNYERVHTLEVIEY